MLAVIVGLAFVAGLPAPSLDTATTPTPTVQASELCANGEKHLAAGKLDEAEVAFAAADKAGQPCPEASPTAAGAVSPAPGASVQPSGSPSLGLTRVRQARVEAARRAIEGLEAEARGDTQAAIAAYTSALALDAGQPVATVRRGALTNVSPAASPSPIPYALALALAREGFDDKAREAAQEEIKSRAEKGLPPAFPSELKYLVDDPEPLRSFNRLAHSYPLIWALSVLLALFGVGLILIGVRNRRRHSQERLELGDISGADGAFGAAIKATIANEIQLLQREVVGDRLGIVIAPDAALDIPVEVIEELPKGKLISALLNWTQPAPWTLTGALLWDPRRGVGMSLSLVSPDKKPTDVTIWDDDLRAGIEKIPDAAPASFGAPHARLARAAGAWLAYTRVATPKQSEELKTLAATTWTSYALFRSGAEAIVAEDYAGGARWSAMALAEDPMNPGATFNAGTLRLLRGRLPQDDTDVEYIDDADDYFDRVDESLRRPLANDRLGALRLRFIYNRALLEFERATRARATDGWKAWDTAVLAARDAWHQVQENSVIKPTPAEDRFFNMVEDATFGLLGGALAGRAKVDT